MTQGTPAGYFLKFLRLALLAFACAGAACVPSPFHATDAKLVQSPPPIVVIAAPARGTGAASALAVIVDVDATQPGSQNAELWKHICATVDGSHPPIRFQSDTDPAGPSRPGRSPRNRRPDCIPAALSYGNKPAADRFEGYAVRSREGATVCLWNHAPEDTSVQLGIRTGKAPYKVELLTLTPERLVAPAAAIVPIAVGTQAGMPSYVRRLTRVRGRDVSAPAVLPFTFKLPPGQLLILRLTDTAFASRAALWQVRDQLRRSAATSPDLSRRLSVIFAGTGSCEKAISASSGLTADRRRIDIHRYLLVLGQAHALQRNFPGGGDRGTFTELQAATVQLTDALADTSATLMGLVPAMSLSAEPPGAPHSASEGAGRAADEAHTLYATVSVSNQGSRSAELVKIGLSPSSLPAGVRCEPAEPALFVSLAPSQTARAAFVLRWKPPVRLTEEDCVGDVSYFTAGAPAHLRPRAW